MNWIELKDAASVEKVIQESVSRPDRYFVIFKHSTRCGTSRIAMNSFEKEWKLPDPVYFVNVVQSRQASNAVSDRLEVLHESPQVLVVRNGKSIYDNSHYLIDAGEIMALMASEPA